MNNIEPVEISPGNVRCRRPEVLEGEQTWDKDLTLKKEKRKVKQRLVKSKNNLGCGFALVTVRWNEAPPCYCEDRVIHHLVLWLSVW